MKVFQGQYRSARMLMVHKKMALQINYSGRISLAAAVNEVSGEQMTTTPSVRPKAFAL